MYADPPAMPQVVVVVFTVDWQDYLPVATVSIEFNLAIQGTPVYQALDVVKHNVVP